MRGELETEQNCNILLSTFLSRSPRLLNWGPGGPASAGTWFSFQHLLSNWSDCSIGGPEGPLCWVLVLSRASYPQLIWTSCRQGYIIIWRPPTSCERHNFTLNSTPRQSRLYPDIPRPDAPFIYSGAFPILTAWTGWRSICNKWCRSEDCCDEVAQRTINRILQGRDTCYVGYVGYVGYGGYVEFSGTLSLSIPIIQSYCQIF